MRDLAAGLRYLGEGQRWVGRHGRWWGFGLLPALVTLVLYAGALAALGVWGGDLAAWATPFADGWAPALRSLLRGLFTALLFGAGLLLAVVTFTAVTLLVGDPFYEALSERVEESEGGCPEGPDLPLWRALWNSARDSLYVLVRAVGLGLLLFVLGFVPVLGQTVVPVLGFCVSGFFLAVELTGVAMQRRAVPVRERLALLRGRRMLALGFGVPLVLLFLLPLVAVFAMPGAVAGATLMVRDLVPDAPVPGGPVPDADQDGEAPGAEPADPYGHLPQVPGA
ncbi:EI24 domain-containing protein [Streptacidiphilus sp. ASG 303]|uniref:EI24 domain-containing protein n=1 Tax=Streptacidiphilus sp. ASG 303 TaxID=2896847 RepID=UPI001E2EC51D|nr:EI24 domain-containing protein [Streptacidiphilus sp. ASG 303]MCD0482635.1 EI24 domain-containing protein [Streptacidiphilus sp. ASG 303]